MNTRLRAVDLEHVVRQSDSRALLTVDRSGPINYLELTREVVPEIAQGPYDDLRAAGFPELRRLVQDQRQLHRPDDRREQIPY